MYGSLPFKPIMTSKLYCARSDMTPADQQKVKEIYSQVVGVMSDLAQNPRFVTSYVFEVNIVPAASAADAMPIPLAQVEAEIFAEADGPLCDICHIQLGEKDALKGICETCRVGVDDGIKHYTEEFALASVHGKDAVRLFVLRQRADNCRDIIADAAGSYDGYLELHEASLEEKMLNKLAAKCLERLPASFAPWWREAWTHEKWCQVYDERKAAGWPLASADVPIVQRLAAAAVAKEDKIYQMNKAHQQEIYALKTEHYRERLEAWEEGATQGVQDTEAVMKHRLKELEHKHAEVLANIERARKEDMEAVESRHQRELTEAAARHKREIAERDKRYVDAQNPEEKLQTQLAMLQKKYDALLKLVGPTQKLMTSNPELFGGEVRGSAPAPGEARCTSSPRPPPMIRLPQVKEEDTERLEKFLKGLEHPLFRYGAVVESHPVEGSTSPLPGLVEVEPSTEGLCMALTEAQYQEMVKAEAEAPIIPYQPMVCGTAGCIDCPAASAAAEPVAEQQPEPVAEQQPEPVAEAAAAEPPAAESVANPKPNYNHPNWPSPMTKRFAKHLAKHSGLRSPWHIHDPKSIKTHQDALEYIAKRVNISVETLLGWTMKQYQTTYEPSTLVKGTNAFQMGTAPATW